MATYEITVTRKTDREGTLRYTGTIQHEAKCYWNPTKRIPAKTYADCSATRMDSKSASDGTSRHGIYLPNVQGFSGIFIHYGTNLQNINSLKQWSQGCIVMPESDVLKIWNDIAPKNAKNVSVTVTDADAVLAE